MKKANVNKTEVLVCDLETTTYDENDPKSVADYISHMGSLKITRAYSIAVCPVNATKDEDVTIYGELTNFLIDLDSSDTSKKVFIHNLKFDGEFIIGSMFGIGKSFGSKGENGFGSKGENSFNAVKNDVGEVYKIEFVNFKRKKIEILDSAKILRMSLRKMTDSFNVPHKKTDMEFYNKYSLDDLSESDLRYIRNDVLGLAESLNIVFNLLGGKNIKLTASSIALNTFKGYLKTKVSKEDIKAYKEANKCTSEEAAYRHFFPKLSKIKVDEKLLAPQISRRRKQVGIEANLEMLMHQFYKGGWCYCNEKYKGKKLDNLDGGTYDCNSMYPAQAEKQRLPIGEGKIIYDIQVDEETYLPINLDESKFYFLAVSCDFILKDDKLPLINIKYSHNYDVKEWLKQSQGDNPTIYVTLPEWKKIVENYWLYDVKVEFGVEFDAIDGKEIFGEYFGELMKKKIDATKRNNKAERYLYKLLIDSLTGKFGTNCFRSNLVPLFSDDTKRTVNHNNKSITVREGRIKWIETYLSYDTSCEQYCPLICAITSYARVEIASKAEQFGDNWLYSDTDCLKVIDRTNADKILDIDEFELGKYKLEDEFDSIKVLGTKLYVQKKDDEITIKAAGLPDKGKEKFVKQCMEDNKDIMNEFREGVTIKGAKLSPHRVNGGVILMPMDFTIKERGNELC